MHPLDQLSPNGISLFGIPLGTDTLFLLLTTLCCAAVCALALFRARAGKTDGDHSSVHEIPPHAPRFRIQTGGITLSEGTLTLWLVSTGGPLSGLTVSAPEHEIEIAPTDPRAPGSEHRIRIDSVADSTVRFSVGYPDGTALRWVQDFIWELRDGEATITPLGHPAPMSSAPRTRFPAELDPLSGTVIQNGRRANE